jgi:hypothetical protein
MEQPQIRLVHWYDTKAHRNACGAPGQSNSTKHVRGVTCSACLALSARSTASTDGAPDAVSYVQ